MSSTENSDQNPYAPTTIAGESYDPVQAFGSPDALKRVATGLNLVYWSIAIILLSVFGGIVLVAVGGATGNAFGLFGSVGLMLAGILLGVIVGLVGRVFCLAVPEATEARSMIFGAVICDVLAILIPFAEMLTSVPVWFERIPNFLSLVSAILFVIFMKRVANFIHKTELAERAQSLITLGLTMFVLAFLMVFAAALVGPAAALLVLVVIGVGLFMFLRYVRLLVDLRKAILARD